MKRLGWALLPTLMVTTMALAGDPPQDKSSLMFKRVVTNLRLNYPADSVEKFLGIPPLQKKIQVPDSLMSQGLLAEIAGDRLWISEDLNVAAIVTTQRDTISGADRYYVTIRVLYNYRDKGEK